MKFLLSIFICLMCWQCGVNEPERRIQAFGVYEVEVTESNTETVTFKALVYLIDPCWDFEQIVIDWADNHCYLKFFFKRQDVNICPTVIDERELPAIFYLQQKGEITFHFWQSDSASVDTTLIF